MYSRCSHLGPLAGKLRPWSRVHRGYLCVGLCAKPRVSLSDIPFCDAKHFPTPVQFRPSLDSSSRPLQHLLSR